MYMNQVNEFDEQLTLCEEQDVTATANGLDSGAVAIERNVSNVKNQSLMVNIRLKNDATADYAILIQSSDDNFSTTKTEKEIAFAPGAANTAFITLEPFAIAPSGDEVRIRFVRTAGTLSDVTAWLTPSLA